MGATWVINNNGCILRGDLKQAMDLHKQQELICHELGNRAGLAASLGNQASILDDWGRLEEANRRSFQQYHL